ncbi:MAG: hypothetical protein ACRC9U_00950 [Metamycoplasmataceae bacterium]
MHNTQFPYFANRKNASSNVNYSTGIQFNPNQQILTRVKNGWIIQGNTQSSIPATEEPQSLSLFIVNNYLMPLNNINKQTPNVYYNSVPQPQYYPPTSQVPPVSFVPQSPNVYYNSVPQPQYYPPTPQVPPVSFVPQNPNVYYNSIPQPQYYPPTPQVPPVSFVPQSPNVYYNSIPQPQCYPPTPPTPLAPNHSFNNFSQCHQTIPNHSFNNVPQCNRPPTAEELLPLIHEAMDIARTQKTLLHKFIDCYTKYDGK